MDSRISLALANKLRMLFERDDRFLTHPLGVGFDYRYLSFMEELSASGLTPQEQLNDKGDFARLMNCIPQDSAAYQADPDRMLWAVTRDVLVGADYAESGLTAAEQQQLDAAIDYLTDVETEDGEQILVYSAVVRRYYEHKTAYEAAAATYLDEKITVESTTGPEGDRLKAQWAGYREKQLRDAMDKEMADWVSLGHKAAVEDQQAIQRRLEPKKYLSTTGQAYLSDIELSELSDVTGNPIGFCTTFFSPTDVFRKTTPWTRITLTRAEIDTLAQTAPAPLKAVFGAGQTADDGIVSITLEYNNVPILRPWFHPELFASRYWKTVDGSVVSNGATPRGGLIPAYITSILVVRNLTVTRKKTRGDKPLVLPILGARAIRELKFSPAATLDVNKARLDRAALSTRLMTVATLAAARPAAARLVTAAAARPAPVVARPAPVVARPAPVAARPAPAVARPGAVAVPARPSAAAVIAARPILIKSRPAMLESVAALQPVQRKAFVAAKYRGTTILSPKIVIPPRPPATPPAHHDELVTEPYEFPGVAVIAYVCKRVPRAPDPDPALTW